MACQRLVMVLLLLFTSVQVIVTRYQKNNFINLLNIREEITTYFESVSTKYKLDDCSELDIILYMFSRLHLAGSLSNDTSIIYLSCSTGCVANPRQFSLRPIDEIHENQQKIVCSIDTAKPKRIIKKNTGAVVRIVVSREDEPFIIKTKFNRYTGVLFELINEAARQLNFEYQIVQFSDNVGDSLLSNGSWNGILGMLQRQEADIALGSFFITYARKIVVDFFPPLVSDSYTVVIQKPNAGDSMLRLVKLFTPTVWLLYICSLILATLVNWFISQLSSTNSQTKKETVLSSFWYIYIAQLNQMKQDKIVMTVADRILELTWRFGFFLLMSIYTGGFIAHLTATRLVMPFVSLNHLVELANSGKTPYKICIENDTAFSFAIQNSDRFKDLNSLMNESNIHAFKSLDICIKELLTDPYVTLITDNIYAKELQKRYCGFADLMVLDDSFFPIFASVAHRKNFKLAPLISKKITQFIQNGLFTKWMDKYSEPRKCKIFEPLQLSTNSEPLTISHIAGAFILFLFGTTVSIIGFVTEIHKLYVAAT